MCVFLERARSSAEEVWRLCSYEGFRGVYKLSLGGILENDFPGNNCSVGVVIVV